MLLGAEILVFVAYAVLWHNNSDLRLMAGAHAGGEWFVDRDAGRHEMEDVLALVQEQMADLAAVQHKQAAMTARGTAADGTVEVTVDARGMVTKTVIDESYLEDYEFEELGGHVTTAAQAAAAEVGRQVAALLVPLGERRKAFPSLSDIVEGAPDVGSLLDGFMSQVRGDSAGPGRGDGEDGSQEPMFPTVRG